MPVLETLGLKKQYALGNTDVNALRGVNFVVQEGEFVAIMGPSGSGKSTLLHLIGGLDQPSDGEVMLGSQRLSIMKDREVTLLRRRNVGFVFQFFNLVPMLSAEDNVLLPILIDGKNSRDYQEHTDQLFSLIGLSDRKKHRPEQLSGGEQQRVALARALVTRPAILLADEPTGNLDSKTGAAIMELLRRSCDELGQTIIVVSHDARAASYADRVVFLLDGLIVEEVHLDQVLNPQEKIRSVIEVIERLET